MFGTIIRELIDRKLTTLKELEEVTGRGTSTIYRWINDESEPHFTDVRLLVRQLEKPEAKRTLVGLLTSDLPIVVDWLHEEELPKVDHERPAPLPQPRSDRRQRGDPAAGDVQGVVRQGHHPDRRDDPPPDDLQEHAQEVLADQRGAKADLSAARRCSRFREDSLRMLPAAETSPGTRTASARISY